MYTVISNGAPTAQKYSVIATAVAKLVSATLRFGLSTTQPGS